MDGTPEHPAIDFDDILSASAVLASVTRRTPLLQSGELDAHCGGRILLKAEHLQLGGSFKLRGAYTCMHALDPAVRRRGVVAWSSGNHGRGVALAARMLGSSATIVMPADAPQIKRRAIEQAGAEVVAYDRYREDREAIARGIAGERGTSLVPSYDHPKVIAGQGTVGLEAGMQAIALGIRPDVALLCCGGGGLSAGSGMALRALFPDIRLWAVEPAGYDDHARSLAAGRRVRADVQRASVCDSLLAPCPGELTFPINRRQLDGVIVVDDASVRRAVAFAATVLKQVVEPGGAVALAALLTGRPPVAGKDVLCVLSGGNVDADRHAELVRTGLAD